MASHLEHRYCPECRGILDGTRVGEEEYCERCQIWIRGYSKGYVPKGTCGHEVTAARHKRGRILYAWCEECVRWQRLTYCAPPRKAPSPDTQEEIPF